jgi:hypothetical protein
MLNGRETADGRSPISVPAKTPMLDCNFELLSANWFEDRGHFYSRKVQQIWPTSRNQCGTSRSSEF